jgi:hypothetical protein
MREQEQQRAQDDARAIAEQWLVADSDSAPLY